MIPIFVLVAIAIAGAYVMIFRVDPEVRAERDARRRARRAALRGADIDDAALAAQSFTERRATPTAHSPDAGIRITSVDLPFGDLVTLAFKWWCACAVAMIPIGLALLLLAAIWRGISG